jgi:hypothetical protein
MFPLFLALLGESRLEKPEAVSVLTFTDALPILSSNSALEQKTTSSASSTAFMELTNAEKDDCQVNANKRNYKPTIYDGGVAYSWTYSNLDCQPVEPSPNTGGAPDEIFDWVLTEEESVYIGCEGEDFSSFKDGYKNIVARSPFKNNCDKLEYFRQSSTNNTTYNSQDGDVYTRVDEGFESLSDTNGSTCAYKTTGNESKEFLEDCILISFQQESVNSDEPYIRYTKITYKKGLVFPSITSTKQWPQNGSATVEHNNWTFEITFGAAETDPTYTATNGEEEQSGSLTSTE